MMTFTYVAAISGICAWSLPGGAESMFQRMSVSMAVSQSRNCCAVSALP
jgi:pentatricopeptide repeat protein